MARRRGLAKYKIAEMKPAGAPSGTTQQPVERSVLFGTRENRKVILILSGVGLVVFALAYYLVAAKEEFSVAAMIFTAINGALLGMLLGQLTLVYPDRAIVVCTLMGVLLGETLYVVLSVRGEDAFAFNSEVLRDMTAIFFWAGWLGFWIGFIAFAKRQARRQRFQQRVHRSTEDLPGQLVEEEEPPAEA